MIAYLNPLRTHIMLSVRTTQRLIDETEKVIAIYSPMILKNGKPVVDVTPIKTRLENLIEHLNMLKEKEQDGSYTPSI